MDEDLIILGHVQIVSQYILFETIMFGRFSLETINTKKLIYETIGL